MDSRTLDETIDKVITQIFRTYSESILSIRGMSNDELGHRLQLAGLRLERGIPLKAPRQFVVEIEAIIREEQKALLMAILGEELRRGGVGECDEELVEETLFSFAWGSFLILEYAERTEAPEGSEHENDSEEAGRQPSDELE